MRGAELPLRVIACGVLIALSVCGPQTHALTGPVANPPTGLQPAVDANSVATFPATDPTKDLNAPSLDMMITKSMLYAAGLAVYNAAVMFRDGKGPV